MQLFQYAIIVASSQDLRLSSISFLYCLILLYLNDLVCSENEKPTHPQSPREFFVQLTLKASEKSHHESLLERCRSKQQKHFSEF